MLRNHVSGLPVTDAYGELVGVASESDFLRRSEIGTGCKRPVWLQFLLGPGRAATDFVRERGRKVEDVMPQDVITVVEETPQGARGTAGAARVDQAARRGNTEAKH